MARLFATVRCQSTRGKAYAALRSAVAPEGLTGRAIPGRSGRRSSARRSGDHAGRVEAIGGGTFEEALGAARFHPTENWKATRVRPSKRLEMEE
jgi:hypothetical protein